MHLETRLNEVQLRCQAEDKRESDYPGNLICDPKELVKLSIRQEGTLETSPLVGIQARLAEIHQRILDFTPWPLRIAFGLLIFSTLPWVWYFFLGRVRELREAVIGR